MRSRWVGRVGAAVVCAMTATVSEAVVNTPVLKWQRGGCFGSWCQTGWYSSPAVTDLDNDGQSEVLWGSYDLVALNGATGALRWRAASGNRVWPGVAVADLTGDGTLEIVVGRGSNLVTVYDRNGVALWSRNPFSGGEVRTLAVDDLDNDGQLEIIVGRASGGSTLQLNVYQANGNVRPGWPARRNGEAGFGWGMYNENVAIGDLNNDGRKEVIGPTDTHYITALSDAGNQLTANPMYGAGKVWSQVGVHVDHPVDLRGYANCGSEHRPNFANSAPAISDLNNDGTLEVIVPGDVYNCAIEDGPAGDLYVMPWIFRYDRTRWSGSGFDWTVLPTPAPGSAPLSEDYNVIENNVQNAVVADLDNNGIKEILYPSYDGKVHAYWLDKTEHGSWPHDVPGSGIRFAGEPIIADLDNDGQAEVLFTSWPQKGGTLVGQLHILSSQGVPLQVLDLPASFPAGDWNGGLAAPTIANIDADADFELVVGTVHSGVVAYDLPGTAGARILWGTGRGNMQRTGSDAPVGRARHQTDYNKDGRSDLLWQQSNGATYVWFLNGVAQTGGRYISDQPLADWRVVAGGDINRDGNSDVILQHTDGRIFAWFMDGTTQVGGGYIRSTPLAGWSCVASGDFNRDGKIDVVLQDTDGRTYVWYLNGLNIIGSGAIYAQPLPGWRAAATGDWNNDGRLDLLWQHTDGRVYVWYLNGLAQIGGAYVLSTPLAGWRVIGAADPNRDNRRDVVWQHADGRVYVWYLSGVSQIGGVYIHGSPLAGWRAAAIN